MFLRCCFWSMPFFKSRMSVTCFSFSSSLSLAEEIMDNQRQIHFINQTQRHSWYFSNRREDIFGQRLLLCKNWRDIYWMVQSTAPSDSYSRSSFSFFSFIYSFLSSWHYTRQYYRYFSTPIMSMDGWMDGLGIPDSFALQIVRDNMWRLELFMLQAYWQTHKAEAPQGSDSGMCAFYIITLSTSSSIFSPNDPFLASIISFQLYFFQCIIL